MTEMPDGFVIVDDTLTIFAEKETEKAAQRWIRDKGCLMAHKGEYRIMEHDAALAQKRKN